MFCASCGKQNADGAKFCRFCGFKLISTGSSDSVNDNSQADAGQSTDGYYQQGYDNQAGDDYYQQGYDNQAGDGYYQQGYDNQAGDGYYQQGYDNQAGDGYYQQYYDQSYDGYYQQSYDNQSTDGYYQQSAAEQTTPAQSAATQPGRDQSDANQSTSTQPSATQPDANQSQSNAFHPAQNLETGASRRPQQSSVPNATQPNAPRPAATQPNANQPIPKKYLIGGIVGAAVLFILLCIGCIAAFNASRTINLNKFVVVEVEGYEGYGKAKVYVDWDAVDKKYGKKLKYTRLGKKQMGLMYKITPPLLLIRDAVSVELEKSENLSNGDKIKYVWTVDDDIYKKYVKARLKYKDKDYKVDGLAQVSTFDAFADLEVKFEGTSPDGYVSFNYNGTEMSSYDFKCDTMNGLSNGDTITVTIPSDDMSVYADRIGKIPAETEKDYEVSGLDEYVTSFADLPDSFISTAKSDAEDTIFANFANDDGASVSNLEYAGYVYIMRKDDGNGYIYNALSVIYKGTVSSTEGRFSAGTVYFPVQFNDILKNENGVNYDEAVGIIGSSDVDGSYSTKGYTNPFNCYIDIAEANRENYDIECGDGFELYSEYTDITSLADISDTYKETLKADAIDRIKSYTASSYDDEVSVGELTFKGDYLLVAKNLGTDFEANNSYILVFTAVITHEDGDFDPTPVYYPVKYDGIVQLPGDEYMISASKGIVGNSDIDDSWYSTRGYVDGKKMYDEVVTANRETYKYEVSEGLKEFGE